ncbi:MAG TPA: YihY/virulence factor BrkB family protein [Bryobacteraceae bacterium]|nr:YihY/virulence factor BrkB family protein [Bryobacteraceae bacterium]
MATTPKLYLMRAGGWERFWPLVRAASLGLYQDGCFGIAKGAAYSALLSFFPLLTTLAAVLVQAHAEAVSRTIARLLYDVVPPGTEEVVRTLFIVHGERPKSLLIGAIVLALWAGSGGMMSLMEGFRAVYRIPSERPFLRERGMATLLVLVSALPVLGASALIVFGKRGERELIQWMGLEPTGDSLRGWVLLAGQALRFVLPIGAVVMGTTLVYYFGPNRKQVFLKLFPGAMLATFLWLLSTLVFGWYVGHISHYNVLYGGVGAGLALLVWMYVLSLILLFGCEFNAARERMLS